MPAYLFFSRIEKSDAAETRISSALVRCAEFGAGGGEKRKSIWFDRARRTRDVHRVRRPDAPVTHKSN
jgi:hypothetical protein